MRLPLSLVSCLCLVATTARAQLVTYNGWSLATPLIDVGLATPPMHVIDAGRSVSQGVSLHPACASKDVRTRI
jgi:hypothetical protein